MGVDPVRVRSVDDVVLVFAEPDREFTQTELSIWYDTLAKVNASKSMVLTVGPLLSSPDRRRTTIGVLQRLGVRLVAVTSHRLNHGLVGMFSYLGVPVTSYPWSRLEDAARDVASRVELVGPITRAALTLRGESPAAVGLDPNEG